jgi:hypothetical protein
MNLILNKTYLSFTVILLSIEILIAVYLKTGFIRYTAGDFLSVIFLYCFFKSFLKANYLKLSIFVLIFAFIIEFMQLINVLKWLNLEQYKLLKIIFGSTFQISDLVAYTFGTITILIVEYFISKPHEQY